MIRNVTATKTPGADFDAIVIGGGFGGLYAVHKLRNDQGLHVKAYDWTCNGFVPVTYLIMPPWPRMRAG